MPIPSPFFFLTTTVGLSGARFLWRAFRDSPSPEDTERPPPSTNGSAALAIADLDTTQQRRTRRALRVARGWGALSVAAGAAGLALGTDDAASRAFFGVHLACGLLATGTSQVALSLLRRRSDPAYVTQERLALADLSVGAATAGVGALLSTNDTPGLRGAGRALLLQSAFIVSLDSYFYFRTRSTRHQLESHIIPIARRLPLEATLH